MKKILSIIFSSIFLMTSAYAGGMIGVKAGYGTLDGERTIDADHGLASGSIDHEYGAIFAEFEVTDVISVGVEFIPLTATIDTKSGTTADSHATLEDHKTIYVLVPLGDTPLYAKAGYSHADATVKANYTTTTINSAPDAVEGPMIGLGAQFESPIPFLDVVRLEATYTDYGKMTIDSTSTGSGESDVDTRSGEAEQITFTIGLAKSF